MSPIRAIVYGAAAIAIPATIAVSTEVNARVHRGELPPWANMAAGVAAIIVFVTLFNLYVRFRRPQPNRSILSRVPGAFAFSAVMIATFVIGVSLSAVNGARTFAQWELCAILAVMFVVLACGVLLVQWAADQQQDQAGPDHP